MDTKTKIATENPDWGFFGTVQRAGLDAAELFDATARALIARLALTPEEARSVLDDKIGRHMADEHQAGDTAETLVARLIARGWRRDILRAAGRASKANKIALLAVNKDEVPHLRFALDHALTSISEAHPEDRAHLKALLGKLDAAERKVRR